METADHAYINATVRDLTAWYKLTQKIVVEYESLKNKIVEYENRSASVQAEYNKRVLRLEDMDKKIREKNVLLDSRTSVQRDDLERRRNDLAEREAVLTAREAQLRDQQKKLDTILAAAENQDATKKRGPGRPALAAK